MTRMMGLSWIILFFAILFEVAGTLALKYTDGMTRLWPTLLMFAFYLASLFGLSVAIRRIPVGIAYAVWSGLGTLIVAAGGVILFKEEITLLRLVSTMLVVAGVAGLYLAGSGN